MKKTVIFLITLVLVSVLAYFGGYHLVISGTSKVAPEEQTALQKQIRKPEMSEETPGEHYVAKIEQDMLFIYEMPENIIYDSMRTETMHFPVGEIPALREGVVFQTLPEVYEFLENSMS